ncbi:putative lipoyl synthase [archaeon GW2011_AR15]|nr:putative lipoyl synthase [archaeon GW2011_AR15]MBS3104077.1 lipoyl synthase [Candidatus Woesearchaeota archaeon]
MKPEWLRIMPPKEKFSEVKGIISSHRLNTVCQEAHCPNMSECWSSGTATFMLMGDTCTRGCRFCAVKTGKPGELDRTEPARLAKAIKELGVFDYVVLTSVDRDDLEDQGANHLAECIREIKKQYPGIIVEILIPDFRGDKELLRIIADAGPEVIAHNVETVERLQRKVRDYRANYMQSLSVLRNVKKLSRKIYTKTSIMLGLGEKEDEVIQAMKDLRAIDVNIITFGQYLRPSQKHLAVSEYVKPEKFKYYEEVANSLGFLYCASGPFVRSSYKAGELFLKGKING